MSVSKRLRFEIFRRDNHACRYCGASAPEATLTIDHVVPVTLGGTDDPSNLVAACKDCNSGKSATSPGAELVAGVADDALRWARAQLLAGEQMLADLGARDGLRAQFKARWDRWQGGDGKPVDLPDQWGASVDRFVSMGLPMPVLLDCVDKAMHNKRISYHDLFRYMCGIAWKRVEELRCATASMVTSATPQTTTGNSPYRDALDLLYGHLDDVAMLTLPTQVTRLADEFDDRHVDDEDRDGSQVDYSTWSADLKASVHLLEAQLDAESDSDDTWSQHICYLIVDTLGGDYKAWLDRARTEWVQNGVASPDWRDVDRTALRLAVEERVRGASNNQAVD